MRAFVPKTAEIVMQLLHEVGLIHGIDHMLSSQLV